MVPGVTTSSAAAAPAVRMVSKIGAAAQSGLVLVKASPGGLREFECPSAGNVCRWGDYAGAAPDPQAPNAGAHGRVWLTNGWASGGTSTAQANWRTHIWQAAP
jgi:hypothetical protein